MRRITFFLRCLLLGVITSIAVAWALAAWLPNSHCTHDFSIELLQFSSNGRIEVTTHERPGMIRRMWCVDDMLVLGLRFPPVAVDGPIRQTVVWSRDRFLGDTWGRMPAVRQRDPRVPDWAFEDARGWPIPCLWYSVSPVNSAWGGGSFVFSATPAKVDGGILLTSPTNSAAQTYALPYLPIWKGLAINTAFYAIVWAGTLAAHGGLRTTLRRRRGLCPRCAYDLKHDHAAGCPECGWNRTVPAQSVTE